MLSDSFLCYYKMLSFSSLYISWNGLYAEQLVIIWSFLVGNDGNGLYLTTVGLISPIEFVYQVWTWLAMWKISSSFCTKVWQAANMINGAKHELSSIVSQHFDIAIHFFYMCMEYKKEGWKYDHHIKIVLGTRKLNPSFIKYLRSPSHN